METQNMQKNVADEVEKVTIRKIRIVNCKKRGRLLQQNGDAVISEKKFSY